MNVEFRLTPNKKPWTEMEEFQVKKFIEYIASIHLKSLFYYVDKVVFVEEIKGAKPGNLDIEGVRAEDGTMRYVIYLPWSMYENANKEGSDFLVRYLHFSDLLISAFWTARINIKLKEENYYG